MRLFTQLDPTTFEKIQSLVRDGEYDSVEQFLRVAAQNQLAIERSQGNGETQPTPNTPIGSNEQHNSHWEYIPPRDIPTGLPFPIERSNQLLFSQYYRFFPLKCALYLVAELTAEMNGPVPIDDVRDHVKSEIVPIRDGIVAWEEENDIKKKNRKSTGLPKEDVKNPERSMKRYLNHYVGKIQHEKGQPTGFGHVLGYLSFEENDGEWWIQLSPSGSEFVQLSNPLLENGPDAPTLSEEEQAFVIETIREELDEEYRFMNFVYDTLLEAEESYTNHLPDFRDFLEDSPMISGELSDNNVRSRVGGAISRMVELGVLERGRRRGWYNTRKHADEYESVATPSKA